MSYLLLLALVLVTGFVCIRFPRGAQKTPSELFFTAGFVFIGLGLLAELILAFTLDETAAKLFYWARGSMAIAWVGQGMLLALFPGQQRIRWLSIALLVSSFVMMALVFLTQVTAAQDWYSTAKPIYGQIGDLLATNRPTRWGALGLNLYGLVILLAGPFDALFSRSTNRNITNVLASFLVVIGAIGLFIPLYWLPSQGDLSFYAVELLAPVALFIGFSKLTSTHWELKIKRRLS